MPKFLHEFEVTRTVTYRVEYVTDSEDSDAAWDEVNKFIQSEPDHDSVSAMWRTYVESDEFEVETHLDTYEIAEEDLGYYELLGPPNYSGT